MGSAPSIDAIGKVSDNKVDCVCNCLCCLCCGHSVERTQSSEEPQRQRPVSRHRNRLDRSERAVSALNRRQRMKYWAMKNLGCAKHIEV